jgi:hypothetical protein
MPKTKSKPRRTASPHKARPHLDADPVDQISREFEAAVAALARFDLHTADAGRLVIDAVEAEFERLHKNIGVYIDRIKHFKATDLKSLRLKARAVYWCNEDFGHVGGGTTDMDLTKSILLDLLNLPNQV